MERDCSSAKSQSSLAVPLLDHTKLQDALHELGETILVSGYKCSFIGKKRNPCIGRSRRDTTGRRQAQYVEAMVKCPPVVVLTLGRFDASSGEKVHNQPIEIDNVHCLTEHGDINGDIDGVAKIYYTVSWGGVPNI